jgi:hypothetical protein
MVSNKMTPGKSLHAKVAITRLTEGKIGWHVIRYRKVNRNRWQFDLNEGDFTYADWAAEYCSGRTKVADLTQRNTKVCFVVVEAGFVCGTLEAIDWKYYGPI